MDLTILAIVFFGSNLLGMYNYVPFTNINPMSTFIQRGIGSLQLTSTVYVLQELGEAAFPDVQKEREQEAIKIALDEYMSARNNATFIIPTRSYTTTAPTVTTTAFVDKYGTIRSQTIANKIREHLHPNVDTHKGIIDAVWEALAFSLIGFTILCIIWKELAKSHEPRKCHETSPSGVTEKSSLSMIVEQLLKDRLSHPANPGHQNVSSAAAASVSNNNELQGLLNQLTVWFSGQLASSDGRLRDTFQSSERVTASGLESITQQLEEVRKKQSEAVSQDDISLLLKDLGDFIDVQKSVSKKFCQCSLTSQSNIQAQTNNVNSHENRLEEEVYYYNKLGFEIDMLKDGIGDLKTKLESCNDESIRKRLQALEDHIYSLKSTTSNTPINREDIMKEIEGFREKQESLEKRVDEVKLSDPTTQLTAFEKNWGQSFQRLDDRMSRLEISLSDIQANVQKHNRENDAANSTHVISIQDLQSRLKIAEDNHTKKISEIESRIYNPKGNFSNNTKTSNMSLEELTRLFKNHHQHEQAEMEWVKSRVVSVADNSDRVSRIENIMRDNSRDVGKCMNKLGIRFELSDENEPLNHTDPVPTPASDVTVKQEVNEPKEKRTDSKGPTAGISERGEHGNNIQHDQTESKQRTNQSINSWTTFSKNTEEREKLEADKRQAEENNLRTQGKITIPQVNLKETYIKGVPKYDEDYSQAEKTEHKIGGSSPSVSGLSQSKWASPGPESALTPDPKNSSISDAKSSGLKESKWASPAPESISTSTSKNASISKSKNWAETPPFTPKGSKQETLTTAEKSPTIPTGPKTPTIRSGRRRKSSSGLRGSIHAPPSTSDDASRLEQSGSGMMASLSPQVRKETSASFRGFSKSESVQSQSGKGKGAVLSGLQGSIHARQPNDADKMDTSEDSTKPASPVESKDKQKPKEKGSDLSGIKQSRWADE